MGTIKSASTREGVHSTVVESARGEAQPSFIHPARKSLRRRYGGEVHIILRGKAFSIQ